MKILKIIEVGIDVRDPIGLYADDDNILRILIDKYEGRCFAECYIVKVERVVKSGDCTINQHGSPNFGTLAVRFEASAIIYGRGETINGCQITGKDQSGSLICSTPTCNIIIAPDPLMSWTVKDQFISVRVGDARYQIGATKVSISAVPYGISTVAFYYKVNPGAVNLNLLENVFVRIKAEEEEINKIKVSSPKAWSLFEQMLYAYKSEIPENSIIDPSTTILTLDKLTQTWGDLAGKYIARDPRINPSQAKVVVCDSRELLPPGSKVRLSTDPLQLILLIFEDYCGHLRTLREKILLYSNEKMLVDHANLWKFYAKMRMEYVPKGSRAETKAIESK